jgi:hypothetical protein
MQVELNKGNEGNGNKGLKQWMTIDHRLQIHSSANFQ